MHDLKKKWGSYRGRREAALVWECEMIEFKYSLQMKVGLEAIM